MGARVRIRVRVRVRVRARVRLSLPLSAFSSTSTTLSRSSGLMNSSSFRPTTSHFERPEMAVALRFHSVTSPG